MSVIAIYRQSPPVLESWPMCIAARFLLMCPLVFVAPLAISAQTGSPGHPPTVGSDGIYDVAASDLKKLDSSPQVEFPRSLSAYEVVDTVTVALTISPEGKVRKAKAVSGGREPLKDAAEKTMKKWAFQPYLVNRTAVSARTEITINFDNTFDHYHDPDGDVPVHLGEAVARTLIVKSAPPQYPSAAQFARIQGTVELRVIVGKDGRVQALHIIRGHPMLVAAAYDAVREWQFKPYVENGKIVSVDTRITTNFGH